MLKLKEIAKDYKVASSYVHALKGVSLSFRKCEFVCILGQSGCGKTTLLNIIGGLDHYTTGDLVIQGKSTKDFKDRDWDVYRNHRIGFIFQSYNLIPHQTVLGNVELALTIAGVGREERRARAKNALERVGLGSELDKRPNQLSGGQMQRVAIARALVNDPDILLADEPTGALDSKTSVEVMELIKEIAGERLVIMVTHNPDLAEQYATRIVRLHDGLVEADSDPYSEEDEAKEFLSSEEIAAEAKSEIAAETPSEENAEAAEAVPAGTEEGASETGDASPSKKAKKPKKPRARMSLLTSLSLSAKNLLTKKGRTIITSVAGSIGIISVCLVLALSSGFNNYIRRTEEDMLSYYPVEILENTIDLTAVMDNAGSMDEMPDMEKIGDRVYVNSFLTQLAQGIAVTNNLSDEYLNYLQKGKEDHPDWFSAIKYSYGVSVTDNLFTTVHTGEVYDREHDVTTDPADRNLSLAELREFYTNELLSLASEYSRLLGYVDLFTNVVDVMPGTSDFLSEEYGDYVLSQYDIIDPDTMRFPSNENEAVLVVGSQNEATDLTLAQLGFIPEKDFMELFKLGEEDSAESTEGEGFKAIPYADILSKQFVLYYNDAVYTQNKTERFTDQPFSYSGERSDEQGLKTEENGKEIGIPVKITAILRLKEGRTYGCLADGMGFTEATIAKYIAANKESTIVKWATSDEAKLPDALLTMLGIDSAAMSGYRSPSAYLNDQYTSIDLGALKSGMAPSFGDPFLTGILASPLMAYLPDCPLKKDPIPREETIDFFTAYKATIANSSGGQVTEDMIDEMITEIEDLPSSFSRSELARAVGLPFVTKNVEPTLGIKLEGTIFVSFTPDLVVRSLVGNDHPNGVYVYPHDFDAKDNVLEYLDAWNDAEGRAEEDKITYIDRVGLLMGIMQTMLDVITYVLVAFTSISLVVSSVMIGIITYVSVVERVKEIGVLRSLGARKRDIKNLFNAETFIIGLAAGLIGVGVTYLLSILVNVIIQHFTGIGGIAALPPLTAFIMVCVSVALTLISGLIPAAAAAKKDPVIALRTE